MARALTANRLPLSGDALARPGRSVQIFVMIPSPSRVAALMVTVALGTARFAAAQLPAALDSAFTRHVAEMARQRAAQLAVAPPAQPENQRAVQQYRSALVDLDSAKWLDAMTALLAVTTRAPNNPMYRGDLAYAHLRLGQFDPAATEYTRAYQAQQHNGWYVLGIGMVRAAQHQFADAAGAADLAVQTDSSVVDSSVASIAAGWFEAAGDRTRALFWARNAVQRSPGDAADWLRVASYDMARNDTTPEGITAVRHFLALRPGDKLGSAIYSNYLYVAGQSDSAMHYAEYAASDSAYRPFAAQVFLAAGRVQLMRRDADNALTVLRKGQEWADSTQRPSFKLFIGRAQLLQVSAALNTYQDHPSCELARAADSLTTVAKTNLRAGLMVDSARTQQLLEMVVAPDSANAQAAVHNCAAAQPAPRGRPQRPAARPAQPARPRP
jgi:tetratricopeptide (TPR) repeat protein